MHTSPLCMYLLKYMYIYDCMSIYELTVSGMEEKVGGGQTEWRPGRGQELQEQGGALRLSAAGSQVHPQLILWLCYEEGVGVV